MQTEGIRLDEGPVLKTGGDLASLVSSSLTPSALEAGLMVQQEDTCPAGKRFGCNSR